MVISKMEITTAHGVMPDKTQTKEAQFYNLDAIISASVNEFLAFRKYDILPDKGYISKQVTATKAETEYAEFNKTQKIVSDFDSQVKRLLEKGGNSDE